MSGSHWMRSLATTVATPAKKCGRTASSSPAVAGPSGTTRVAKPAGYMVLGAGAQTRSTLSSAKAAISAAKGGGEGGKASFGATWGGVTNIDTIIQSARLCARRTSEK